jgi:RHS repeat-associated protein
VVCFSASRFSGKERDTESGLDYFGARYYSSAMGRFSSPDNGEDQDMQDPQSWNLYPYVRNNPVTNTDPDGRDCVVQSRVDDNHETVSVSSGDCKGKGTGSGERATYVSGHVDGYSANGGNSLDISSTNADGSTTTTNAKGAPAFDHPGIDGPANAAIFGQIGNNGMGAIKYFTIGSVAGGAIGGELLAGGIIGAGAEGVSLITEEATVLARASSAVGNQGAKVASREVAEAIAKRFVGEGGRPLLERGTGKVIGEISADGTKIVRWTSIDKAQPYINMVNKLTGGNLHVGW